MKKLLNSTFITILTIMICMTMPACSRFGNKLIPVDSFNYNKAVVSSSNKQMLLNLVRLRYREVPAFLAVSSVITQYFYVGGLSAGVSIGKPTASAADEFIDANALMRYAERPTITYSPLAGQEFSQQLLTPIPREMLFSLVQSGWPPELLLIMGLEKLNHLENLPFSAKMSTTNQKILNEFKRVMELLLELSKRRSIEFQLGNTETPNDKFLVFRQVQDSDTRNLTEEFKSILGLDPNQSTFRVTKKFIGRKPDEITMRVRSILSLMGFLSRGVELPAAHVEEGRAEVITLPVDIKSELLFFPLKIFSSIERPTDAFVAVRHHDHWFYILHSDHKSKAAFALLTYLFELQAPKAQALGPMITVPTSQ